MCRFVSFLFANRGIFNPWTVRQKCSLQTNFQNHVISFWLSTFYLLLLHSVNATALLASASIAIDNVTLHVLKLLPRTLLLDVLRVGIVHGFLIALLVTARVKCTWLRRTKSTALQWNVARLTSVDLQRASKRAKIRMRHFHSQVTKSAPTHHLQEIESVIISRTCQINWIAFVEGITKNGWWRMDTKNTIYSMIQATVALCGEWYNLFLFFWGAKYG